MAIFRKIHVQFWGDIFIQSLTPEQKFFFLYLLTNERTKQCGVYEMIENVVIENGQIFYQFEGGDKIPETQCFLTKEELFKNK